MMRPADPQAFWKKISGAIHAYGDTWSPVRWRPWRALFWNREGFYVLARGTVLAAALAIVAGSVSGTCGWLVRAGAVGLTILFLADAVVANADVAFRSPLSRADVLRSAFLTIASFFQIPLAFAVFYLCYAHSFSSPLTIMSALYFSVITATTVGYGDTYPKTGSAQALVVAEVMTSAVFVSVVLARLIAPASPPEDPA